MFFFHFASQKELVASKVIPLPCTKLIVRVATCLRFFEKFTKMKLADNITKRYQRYKINKIKCFSSHSSHFNCIILKITQHYNSPLQVLRLIPHISMQGEL